MIRYDVKSDPDIPRSILVNVLLVLTSSGVISS
jgi:hypothetical protein